MHFFVVFDRAESGAQSEFARTLTNAQYTCKLTPVPVAGLNVVTPPLDGTTLPGVMHSSVLSLLSHRPYTSMLPHLPPTLHNLHIAERTLMMPELFAASTSGTLHEVFCIGTAAVVIPAVRIGWQRRHGCVVGVAEAGDEVEANGETTQVQDIMLPVVGGEGSCPCALGAACGYTGGAC
jgi:hypothetical protein